MFSDRFVGIIDIFIDLLDFSEIDAVVVLFQKYAFGFIGLFALGRIDHFGLSDFEKCLNKGTSITIRIIQESFELNFHSVYIWVKLGM